MKESQSMKRAKEVLKIEAASILDLVDKVGASFDKAVKIIYRSKGRV